MLLEQKMAGCSEETAGIFGSHKNRLCLKMLMLKFQVQFWTVHQPKATQNQQEPATSSNQQREAQGTQHPASKQTQDHKPSGQRHQLNVTKAVQFGRSICPPSYLKDYVKT